MGFGEAGAVAVVFTGLLVAASVLYPAVDANRERITQAREQQSDRTLARANADLVIVETTYDKSADELRVRVNNTGATTFGVSYTDVLVDGVYVTSYATSVDGTADQTIWAPGEQLNVTYSTTSAPARVKLVAETGVADTDDVTVVA